MAGILGLRSICLVIGLGRRQLLVACKSPQTIHVSMGLYGAAGPNARIRPGALDPAPRTAQDPQPTESRKRSAPESFQIQPSRRFLPSKWPLHPTNHPTPTSGHPMFHSTTEIDRVTLICRILSLGQSWLPMAKLFVVLASHVLSGGLR